jgi:hypothetical protein
MKAVTAICLLLCLATLGSYPWTVGKPPQRTAERTVKQQYAIRFATFFGIICVSLTGAAIGSALILRQARKEYRESSKRNLEVLISSSDQVPGVSSQSEPNG